MTRKSNSAKVKLRSAAHLILDWGFSRALVYFSGIQVLLLKLRKAKVPILFNLPNCGRRKEIFNKGNSLM